MEGDITKDNYDLKGTPRKNPYAQRMKNGYSVTINYDTPADIDADILEGTIRNLIKQPGLKSIKLNLKESTKDKMEDTLNCTNQTIAQ